MQENHCLKLPQMSNKYWCGENEQHLDILANQAKHPLGRLLALPTNIRLC